MIDQTGLEQVALDCARGKGILIDEKLNTARQNPDTAALMRSRSRPRVSGKEWPRPACPETRHVPRFREFDDSFLTDRSFAGPVHQEMRSR